MSRWVFIVPLLLFVALSALLFSGLGKDPAHLPSALVGKQFPAFSLPDLHRPEQLITEGQFAGQSVLVNVWATWCAACRVEHPHLLRIAREEGVALYGLNYKDDPEAARQWLQQYENPYQRVIVDRHGRLGLDLGVYGAPETYLVDGDGFIRHRHVGIVDDQVWREQFLPRLRQARVTGG